VGTGGSAAGSGGSTGFAGAAAGSGGSGAGGSSVGGATAGRGGSSGGSAGSASAGRGGSAAGGSSAGGSSAGGAPAGGSTGTTGCPANATFCSGFEDSAQPANSVFKLQGSPSAWTVNFAVDTAVKHAGNSSLRVKTASDGAMGQYRMLAVPATQGAFWTRFWLRSDIDLNGDHNAFVMASLDDEANNSSSIEFGEDVGIAFNTSDDVRWPTGYGRLTSGGTNPYKLAKDTWHCIEISFDGTGRTQQLFVNGTQLINATSYPKDAKAIKIFKFGFQSFHGPDRHMWYDDVAVAPARIGGCN
jgi:hypothetical protein